MKLILPILLVLAAISAIAQYDSERIIYEDGPELLYTRAIQTTDIDMDGDQDVVAASWDNHTVAWYANDGNGNFGEKQLVSNTIANASALAIADLNGDTIPDIIAASHAHDQILWFQNDGSGNFSNASIIAAAADGVRYVDAADFDNDGDLDVVSASELDNKIAWYENLGNGNFSLEKVLSIAMTGTEMVRAFDMNMDGKIDVMATAESIHSLVVFVNAGDGNFLAPLIISDQVGLAQSFYLADMDNDDDLDVVTRSVSPVGQTYNGIYYFPNNGLIIEDEPVFIDPMISYIQEIFVADVDGNGYQDVLTMASYTTAIQWYPNSMSGFGPVQNISSDLWPSDVIAMDDLNDDDRPELLFENSNELVWMDNADMNDLDMNDPLRQVTRPYIDGLISNQLVVEDMNEDGFDDVLIQIAYPDPYMTKFSLLTSNSSGEFEDPVEIVADPSIAPGEKFFVADLNNDNRPDIIQRTALLAISWYENTGNGVFDQSPNPNYYTGYQEIEIRELADMDGDNDLDILCILRNDAQFAGILFNDGAGDFSNLHQVDNTPVNQYASMPVYAGDIDGDGDKDIIGALVLNDLVLFHYENLGNGTFSAAESQVVPFIGEGTWDFRIDVADINGDEDAELFGTYQFWSPPICFHCPPIFYHRYILYDYDETEFEPLVEYNVWPHGFTDNYSNASYEVLYEDYNGDGLIDLLTPNHDLDGIVWFVGDGDGLFPDIIDVEDNRTFGFRGYDYNYIYPQLASADIENDMDQDVFVLNSMDFYGAHRLEYYRNTSPRADMDEDGYDFLADCNDNDPEIADTIPHPYFAFPVDLCEGDAVQFEVQDTFPGGLYNWTGPNGFTSVEIGPVIDPVFIVNAGTYSLLVSLNDCESPEASGNLVIHESPDVIITQAVNTLTAEGNNIASYQWYLNGNLIIGATGAEYTAAESGDYSVSVISTDDCENVSDALTVIISGIRNLYSKNKIEVFPVPVTGSGSLQIIVGGYNGPLDFRILDIQGQIILEGELDSNPGSFRLPPVAAGTYMIEVSGNDLLLNKRFVVVE